MRRTENQDVYEFTELFAQKFIIEGSSILTNDVNILTTSTIQECVDRYINNYKEGKESFDSKVHQQFGSASADTCLVFAHAEWLWAFAVHDLSISTKQGYTQRMLQIANHNVALEEIYPSGFGDAGMYHKNNKYEEVKFAIQLIQFLKNKVDRQEITTIQQVLDWMEAVCLYQKYSQENQSFILQSSFKESLSSKSLAICNIICHVAQPEKYERIASNNHKAMIVSSFIGLLDKSVTDSLTTDEKIHAIREKLTEITQKPAFDFYETKFSKVWNYSLSQRGFDEVQALQYKKAIILYGPPGTSKTHSAMKLAQALITQASFQDPENVRKYFSENTDIIENKIHRLQLHTNYTYEDFVAGIQLINHQTVPVKGKLFNICELAEKDKAKKIPHVLILDEINRVDLSRLFGEVFSALENRNVPIEVSVANFKLNIPDNLYVIGTMNEIDFSLERIDFALRRRFLWFPYGFKADILRQIIWQKNSELNTRLEGEEVEKFIEKSKSLNDALMLLPELGEQYQIGHTFFGEVVDIYARYKEIEGYRNKMKNQLYRTGGAVSILWNISIKPMIEAFFGNLSKETKDEKLKELESKFINGN